MGQIIRREMLELTSFGIEKFWVVDHGGRVVEVMSHGDVGEDKWVFEFENGKLTVPMRHDYKKACKIMEKDM